MYASQGVDMPDDKKNNYGGSKLEDSIDWDS